MNTEELLSSAGETVEYAKIYVEQQKEYFRLETSKRLAKTTSNLATVAVLAFLGFMVIIFFSIAVGFFLGNYWESFGLAFLAITFFYLIVAFLIFHYKKQIITNPILSLVIREMLD